MSTNISVTDNAFLYIAFFSSLEFSQKTYSVSIRLRVFAENLLRKYPLLRGSNLYRFVSIAVPALEKAYNPLQTNYILELG
jgi:hypothetical protein